MSEKISYKKMKEIADNAGVYGNDQILHYVNIGLRCMARCFDEDELMHDRYKEQAKIVEKALREFGYYI